MKQGKLPSAAAIAGLAIAYALAAKLGLSLAVIDPAVSAVWPPSALALVALLVLGRGVWPAVLAGAFIVNLQVAFARTEFGLAACLLSAAGIAAGNTLEALAGAWAVNRFASGRRAVENPNDLLKLALFAGLLATMIGASAGVLSLSAAGMLPAAAAAGAWLTWWLGDASGILIGAPALLAWTSAAPHRFKGGRAEAAALTALFGGAVWFIFISHRYPTAYIVLPGVIWTAFRFGLRGASVAVLALSGAAVYGTVSGRGPFSLGQGGADLLILQGFLGTVALSTYVLASLIGERERGEREMLHSRDRLEKEVDRRTRELVQAQKMEAVGRLSGAVAHEFNNVLTGVVGLAELIRREAAEGSQTAKDAGDIVAACRRGGALAGRLLSMTRRGGEKKPVSLNEAVAASAKILRLAAGESVELALETGPRVPAVLAAADQLEQVLLNLCLNARDAMPGGGKITIATRAQSVEKTRLLSHGVLKPGAYAALSVADTGAGIPEDIRTMIFEPFFSTKKLGKGSGLGLSIVYGIVSDHGGAIDLITRPGATEFVLYLPATTRAPAATPAPGPAGPPPGGKETLLIADDDEAVRGVLTRVLEPLGYTLLVAHDGEEAWRLYSENEGAVAMGIFDVVMPRLRGDEAYKRIAAKNPGFKILFISGHTTDQAEKTIRARKLPFLAKPFAIGELPALVRGILDK